MYDQTRMPKKYMEKDMDPAVSFICSPKNPVLKVLLKSEKVKYEAGTAVRDPATAVKVEFQPTSWDLDEAGNPTINNIGRYKCTNKGIFQLLVESDYFVRLNLAERGADGNLKYRKKGNVFGPDPDDKFWRAIGSVKVEKVEKVTEVTTTDFSTAKINAALEKVNDMGKEKESEEAERAEETEKAEPAGVE